MITPHFCETYTVERGKKPRKYKTVVELPSIQEDLDVADTDKKGDMVDQQETESELTLIWQVITDSLTA